MSEYPKWLPRPTRPGRAGGMFPVHPFPWGFEEHGLEFREAVYIADWLQVDGLTRGRIAKYLNELGYKPEKGRKWTPAKVTKVLHEAEALKEDHVQVTFTRAEAQALLDASQEVLGDRSLRTARRKLKAVTR